MSSLNAATFDENYTRASVGSIEKYSGGGVILHYTYCTLYCSSPFCRQSAVVLVQASTVQSKIRCNQYGNDILKRYIFFEPVPLTVVASQPAPPSCCFPSPPPLTVIASQPARPPYRCCLPSHPPLPLLPPNSALPKMPRNRRARMSPIARMANMVQIVTLKPRVPAFTTNPFFGSCNICLYNYNVCCSRLTQH